MALSNWDTMAISKDGKPIAGKLTTPGGVSIEIYKNWAHINDPKSWTEGGHFVEPVVMTLQSGNFTYKDLEVYAERGPQNGIYLIALWKHYGDAPDYKRTWDGMVASNHQSPQSLFS